MTWRLSHFVYDVRTTCTCTGKTLQIESAPRFSSARPSWLVQPPRRRIPFSAVALRVLYQYLQGLPTKLQHHGSLSCMLISSRRRRCIAGSGLCTVTGSSDRRRTAENISSNGTSRYVSPTPVLTFRSSMATLMALRSTCYVAKMRVRGAF